MTADLDTTSADAVVLLPRRLRFFVLAATFFFTYTLFFTCTPPALRGREVTNQNQIFNPMVLIQ